MAFAFNDVCYTTIEDAFYDAGLQIGKTVGEHVIIDVDPVGDGFSLRYILDDSSAITFALPDCDLWGRGPSLGEWVAFNSMMVVACLPILAIGFGFYWARFLGPKRG